MKFVWTTLHVSDMEVSLAFYQELIGLKLNQRNVAMPGMELAFLGDGDTQVELVCNKNSNEAPSCKGISLGFKVDSLDDTMEMVKKKGIYLPTAIIQPNPHVKFFSINDPDGYAIQFVEQM